MPASQRMTSVAIASPPLRATPWAERILARCSWGGTALAGAAGDDDEDVAVETVLARMRQSVSDDGVLGAWAGHHLTSGGSAWRARMAMAAGRAAGLDSRATAAITAACELVHQASLLHDDIQDGATTRRGAASIVGRYGAAAAVCLGDHLLFAALALLAEVPEPALIRQFASGLTQAVRGQASELDPGLWPAMTPARSLALARAKTGAMAALPLRSVALAARLPGPLVEQAAEAATRLGAAYQLCDDLEDVEEDAGRGAPNAVLAHHLAMAPAAERAALIETLARAQSGAAPLAAIPAMPAAMAACHAQARDLLAEANALARATPFAAVIVTITTRIGQKLRAAAKARGVAGA